jgi:prevent-host-death family protein
MHEAKSHLSSLVAKAVAGEEVVIARDGKPVVKLVPVEPVRPPIHFGDLKGKMWISPDFDEPDPGLEDEVYNGPIDPPDLLDPKP